MSRFIKLHTPEGLGIAVIRDHIITIEQTGEGGCLIRLKDGQWRSVGTGYENILELMETNDEETY